MSLKKVLSFLIFFLSAVNFPIWSSEPLKKGLFSAVIATGVILNRGKKALKEEEKEDEKFGFEIAPIATAIEPLPFKDWGIKDSSFRSISTEKKQCKEIILNKKNDRRRRIYSLPLKITPKQEKVDIAEFVVQLYMDFNGKGYIGSGTIIARQDGLILILTCAHNVISYNKVKKKEYRSRCISFTLCSKKKQRYSCFLYFVHPSYKEGKGKDIALIAACCGSGFNLSKNIFPRIFQMLEKEFEGYVIGYPGEKPLGDLYGMKGSMELSDEYITYNIDTTGGQSGSPILSNIGEVYYIVGVHTTGHYPENYGTRVNKEIIQWIEACLSSIKNFNPIHIDSWSYGKRAMEKGKKKLDNIVVNDWFKAAKLGDHDVLNILLKEYNINVDLKDNDGYTALDYARKREHKKCISYLNAMKIIFWTISSVNDKRIITRNIWAVSILRKPDSRSPQHIFLIVEGITQDGSGLIRRYDLVTTDKEARFATIKKKERKGIELKKMKKALEAIINEEKVTGDTWSITKSQANSLKEDVNSDMGKNIEYYFLGNRSIFSRNNGHNCFTWSREKLENLGHPQIQFDDKWIDFIAAVPNQHVGKKEMDSCIIM